jgi:hypothetical protein
VPNAAFGTLPLRPTCLVLLSLYLCIHSNSTEKAVITKLFVAYLVQGECDDTIEGSVIFVENTEKETCFGLIQFRPNMGCPFQN